MELRFPGLFAPGQPDLVFTPRPSAPGKAPKGAAPRSAAPGTPGWAFESRKFIGVYCDELNPELAQHFGVKEGTALIVSKLTEDGPAAKAKIRVGDVIVRVDGQRVETVDGLIDLVQRKEKGAKVKIEFLRDKKGMTAEVEVAEEESGGLAGPESLRDFLESWRSYTDAFGAEVRKWTSDDLPEMQKSLRDFVVKRSLRRI
jgi:membrane-associated protease RseP (regulator of RpoE activity)